MTETPLSTHDAIADNRNDHILIYVDGRIVPKAEALVSVYDSGFLLGDGVWEGLRLHDGVIPFLDAHLDRLYEAARFLALDIGRPREALVVAIRETLAAN
ncbi:MAG: aminotransferase class IV, partial [Pseudomonadota bacterium]